ncbi:DUF5320 domain-containing protein [Candidatus Phytoplasma sacchari]|nr:DUF5320 domain-containing protein [Candidatus Phytoplasma sacchari]
MNIEQFFDKINNLYHNNTIEFLFFILLTFIILALIGPIISFIFFFIKIVFKALYRILIFNWNFIFGKNQKEQKKYTENPKISINNQYPDYNNNNKDLTLIEMKILELNQRENRQSHHNLFQIELNQHKLENKLELNKQKNYFEKKMLEQQIKSLEKEIEKIKNKEKTEFQKQNDAKIKEYDNKNNKQKNNQNIDLSIIDEDFVKQIPDYLKKIFYKIKNLENIQFYILNNIMNNKESYYNEDEHAFYVNPKDLVFIKKILIQKNEKIKKLIN